MKTRWLFIIVVAFFLLSRLYRLSDIPPSLYWDEASIAYNAYSISETGRDEWGDFLPIHFRAFGEFKLPVFIYSIVPFVKTFGLDNFSVRLPAVLYSLGIVILTYLLALKITASKFISIWAMFLLTISPWFFIFSRTGYEADAGLFFYLLAILAFLNSFKKKYLFVISIACFLGSMYSYNSFRIISPLTILILLVYYFPQIKRNLKSYFPVLIIAGLIFIVSILPIIRLYKYDAGLGRFDVVKVAKDTILEEVALNYLAHFNPHYLFISGDKNLRNQQQGWGQLYPVTIPLLLAGLFYLVKAKRKEYYLILILLLIGPIPAGLTKEIPHSLRALSAIPFIALLSALGIYYLNVLFKYKTWLQIFLILIYVSYFSIYFFEFVKNYPSYSSGEWQYAYRQLFMEVGYKFSEYDKVIVSDEYAQPYIFAAYYQKIDPNYFQTHVVRNSPSEWSFSSVRKLGNLEFRKINWDQDIHFKNSLVVSSTKEGNPLNLNVEVIKNLDNKPAFFIYETR